MCDYARVINFRIIIITDADDDVISDVNFQNNDLRSNFLVIKMNLDEWK